MKFLREESFSKNHSASYSDLPSSLKEKMDLDEEVEFFNSNMFINNLDTNNNSTNKYYFLNDEIKKHKSDKKRDNYPKFKVTLENIKEENSELETSRDLLKENNIKSKILSLTEKSCHLKNSKIFNQNNKNVFKKILNTISENSNKNKLFVNLRKDKVSKKLLFKNEKIRDKENIKVHNIPKNLLKTNSPLKIKELKSKYLSPPLKKIQNFKSKKNILKLTNTNKNKFYSSKTEKNIFLNNKLNSKKKEVNILGSNLKLKLEKKNYLTTKSESIKNLKEKRKKLFRKMKNCSLNTFKNTSLSINKKHISLKSTNEKLKNYHKNYLKNIYLKEFDFSFNKYVNTSKNLKKNSKKENLGLTKRYKNLEILTKENNKINYNNIENIYNKKKNLLKKNKNLISKKSSFNKKIDFLKEKYIDRSKKMFKNLYIKSLKNKSSSDRIIDVKRFGNVKFKKKKKKKKK